MAGYQVSSNDLKQVPSKYICRECGNVLRDPMQTPCAHFYCRVCVEHLKSGGEAYKCKADGEEFKLSEVFPDGCVRNEIRDLTVHCLHNESGCEWEGKITNLEEHVSGCDFVQIPCIFDKCQAKVRKSKLAEHLERECNQRRAECDYCKEEMPFADLENHVKNDCHSFPIDCTLCDKKDILRGKLREHHDPETGDCEGSKAVCPFLYFGCKTREEMRRSERRHHEQTLVSYHLSLLVHFVLNLRDQVGCYVNELSPLREGITVMDRLKSTVSQLVSQVTAVVRENGNIQEEIDGLRSRLERVEENLLEPDSLPVGQHHSFQVFLYIKEEETKHFPRFKVTCTWNPSRFGQTLIQVEKANVLRTG